MTAESSALTAATAAVEASLPPVPSVVVVSAELLVSFSDIPFDGFSLMSLSNILGFLVTLKSFFVALGSMVPFMDMVKGPESTPFAHSSAVIAGVSLGVSGKRSS